MRRIIESDIVPVPPEPKGDLYHPRGICALFILILFICSLTPLPGRTVLVGIAQNQPKTYWDDSGQPQGIFIDILDHIARAEGWDLKYHNGTWDENLQLLASGKLDLVADMAFSIERSEIFDFHQNPVLFSWSQLYCRKGKYIRSIDDLEGLRLAVLTNSIQAKVLQEMISGFKMSTTLVEADSFDEVLALVRDNQADAAATNYHFGRINARKFNLEETDIIFEPSSLFFAAPKGSNADILKAIDKHIIQLKRRPDTAYYRILTKHSSEEPEHNIPLWMLWAGIMLIFSVLLLIVAVLLYKHQVRKRTAELKKANQEMEIRIEERTEELALAMHQAQVADMLKSAFLATMSHELRTPLNSVIGFTGILMKQMPGTLNEEQIKMLGIVQTSARHLLSLINDVLDISKIEAGELELHYREIELGPVMESAISMFGVQAAEKGLELVLRNSGSPSSITVDERRFEQVLINLLNNAIKFTEQGQVCLAYVEKDGCLHLTVKDTGIGIPPDKLGKLFQPFMQVDTGIGRRYEGSGLGLYISQKIIRMMGGDINVQSQPGAGSIFTVILPLTIQGEPCKNTSSS